MKKHKNLNWLSFLTIVIAIASLNVWHANKSTEQAKELQLANVEKMAEGQETAITPSYSTGEAGSSNITIRQEYADESFKTGGPYGDPKQLVVSTSEISNELSAGCIVGIFSPNGKHSKTKKVETTTWYYPCRNDNHNDCRPYYQYVSVTK